MLLFYVIHIRFLFVHLGNEAGPCNDEGEPVRTWAAKQTLETEEVLH